MLRFVGRKMLNKKWMILGLFIGNLLMTAIAAGSPMYSQAVLQRMLTENLASHMEETGEYPGKVNIASAYNHLTGSQGKGLAQFREQEKLMEELPEKTGTPAAESVTQYSTASLYAVPDIQMDEEKNPKISLGFASGIDSHIQMLAGEMYADTVGSDGFLDVIVSKKMFVEEDFVLNQEFVFEELTLKNGDPCKIRITGVFEPKDPSDTYWSAYSDTFCLVSEKVFRNELLDYENPVISYNARWTVLLDYTQMRAENAQRILDTLSDYEDAVSGMNNSKLSENFSDVLASFVPESQKLNVTLWSLQVPVFVLLAAFIFMVSRQMLSMEENEIAVFKSRGAGRRQILTIYLQQSLLLALAAFVLGIPLGMFICQVLGASNSFLEFVQRAALPVEITGNSLLFAALAAFLSIVAMTVPAFRYSKLTIVAHKQKRQSRWKAPWWQKAFLDVILLGVSLYGLYSFSSRKEELAQSVANGASLDPLLYLSSSLFMLGAGLLALRLFPLLVKLIFFLGKAAWPPSLYASFRRILGTIGQQGFMMIFLILTISLGVFSAQAARTINTSGEERLRYQTGADVVLQEVWNSSGSNEEGGEISYLEPDFSRFESIEGVESVTKVLREDSGKVSFKKGNTGGVTLLGIHTKEFGETAWMKDGLLPEHWYTYLNQMAVDARAVIVSENFRTDYGCKIGDVITYTCDRGSSVEGVICGFVEYWPGYKPTEAVSKPTGGYTMTSRYLVVANYQQLQSVWGVTPYQVWMKLEGSSKPAYDFIEENNIPVESFADTQALITEMKNDPMLQGTNGILTVGFVIVLLLCTVGFLIYWILSIQSRVLQFGIFRAMGMSLREILLMLGNEQLFISGVSIGAGIGIGVLSSHLFIPLIQIAYSSSDQVLPLKIISETSDYIRLFVVIGVMIAACMAILGVLISKIRISQALKLGED